MWFFLRKKIPYLHKHITSAVKVFSQLVVLMLLGQYGLHLHHPRCYEHVVRLHVPEKRENICFNWETGHFDLTKSKMKVIWPPWLCQRLRSLQKEGVSLASDALQTFLIHQFCCSRDLIDEKCVGEPDDVCRQCDGRNLEEDPNTHQWDRHHYEPNKV